MHPQCSPAPLKILLWNLPIILIILCRSVVFKISTLAKNEKTLSLRKDLTDRKWIQGTNKYK